jgi:enoyl-CoA hydratase/carnithine racemase
MQGWGRVGLVDGTGGAHLLRIRNPRALWRLLAEQPRLDSAAATALGLAEDAGEQSATEAGLLLLGQLATLPKLAMATYVTQQRAAFKQGLEDHFRVVADTQAQLLGSPEFRQRVTTVVRPKGKEQ